MFLDKFSASIVLIEPNEHGSELNSVITISGIFEKDVFNIFSEDVEGKVNGEKIFNFDFESIPDFFLVSCITMHFYLLNMVMFETVRTN